MVKRILLLMFTICWSSIALAQPLGEIMQTSEIADVAVQQLSKAPTLDGDDVDWSGIPENVIRVSPAFVKDADNQLGTVDITLKAGYHQDRIYLMIKWPDATENRTHNTWVWDKASQQYAPGGDKEDGMALKFDMGGDFDYCMLTEKEYEADIWLWMAARTDPAGLAEDGMHVFSRNRIVRAQAKRILNGQGQIYIRRQADTGSKIYKTNFPVDYAGDRLPGYTIQPNPSRSIADVQAKGTWADGFWTVELTRQFDTGNNDDVKFELTKPVKGAIAIFDSTEIYHHSTSGMIVLRFAQ